MADFIILGIDISKGWFDVCLLTPTSARFAQFDNDQRGFAALGDWLEPQLTGAATALQACLEATGRYGDELAHWLHEHGHRVSIVNPARVKYYASSSGARHKSDRGDAFLIAHFCLHNDLMAWQPLDEVRQALRAISRQRAALVGMRNQENNRLQAGKLPDTVQTAIKAHLAFIETMIAELDQQGQRLIDEHGDLSAQQQLLTTIQGIGQQTARTLLAEMPPLAALASARSLAAFAGLNPRREESGKGRPYTRLSKAGNAAIRKALYFPAMTAMRHNPPLKAFAERLTERGLAPQQIVAAVMRKLLHYVYGVLKHRQPFDPNYLPC
ncbi:MAG: IS110 family transposase [Ardenticatenales bacterium]|nr:IS110 family transposase [Ardenticatenales bacterium]MCB9128779.1 IS110 family transposase [Ardenticatenales bacterium]MCB9172103.1 IS110 family transposase [Ardenticatenales bacterium]